MKILIICFVFLTSLSFAFSQSPSLCKSVYLSGKSLRSTESSDTAIVQGLCPGSLVTITYELHGKANEFRNRPNGTEQDCDFVSPGMSFIATIVINDSDVKDTRNPKLSFSNNGHIINFSRASTEIVVPQSGQVSAKLYIDFLQARNTCACRIDFQGDSFISIKP